MPSLASKIQSFRDAEYLAQRRLPRFLYEYYQAGSGAGITLRENVRAFEEVSFSPRAATFIPRRDLHTCVLGFDIAMPVIVSSIGPLRIGHRDGEVGVARAAGAAGTIQFVSTATGFAIEDISAAATGPVFLQTYFVGGREGVLNMITRAKHCGCAGLVVNVDIPARGFLDRPVQHRTYTPGAITLSEALKILPQLISRPAWLRDFILDRGWTKCPMGIKPNGDPMNILEMFDAIFEHIPTWDDVSWIREQWQGPLVLKGIITAEDAQCAVDAGANAIVVSNHGGNALDGSPATLRVLPEIVEAVGNRIDVLMDGGVRRGSDVVKAVALGAKAVLIGRAYIFPLMAAGEPGVRQILNRFRNEIDQTLAFLGCPSVSALDTSYLHPPVRARQYVATETVSTRDVGRLPS